MQIFCKLVYVDRWCNVMGLDFVGWTANNSSSAEKKNCSHYCIPPLFYFLLCLTPQFLLSPSLLDLLTVLLIHTFLFTIWVFSFSSFLPSFPTNLPSSYSLFSSSSAAECCSSYLCSRLGMFFLLMTSILSLPLRHLLFSVWAAHLPMFPICPPTPTHLGYSCCFTGVGSGLEAGPCHD